ncbi:transposase [Albidovulum sp.]|uniref:transposase n=1 Tax=Albidovulum sp. TaxID=1872424 RepID=UPI0039B8668C
MDAPKFRSQIEVLSVVDEGRRREWTDAEKVRIVEESLRGFRQCAATARRYEISRALLTRWRRDFRSGQLVAGSRPQLLAVQVASDVPPVLVAFDQIGLDAILSLRSQRICHARQDDHEAVPGIDRLGDDRFHVGSLPALHIADHQSSAPELALGGILEKRDHLGRCCVDARDSLLRPALARQQEGLELWPVQIRLGFIPVVVDILQPLSRNRVE